MKKSTLFLGIMFVLFGHQPVVAQCPSSVTLNISSNTAASCPSSGKVVIGSNSAVGSLQYTILSGPSGAPVNLPQSDSTFNALPAGAYTVKAACASNPSVSSSIGFTIANGYTPISNIATTLTTNCSNGSIVINGVTGGSSPLQYSVVQNSDANYPDNLSVYSATTSYTSLAPGLYQVRVKDACNQIYTKTIEVVTLLPGIFLNLPVLNTQPCASNNYQMMAWQGIDPASGNTIDLTPYLSNGGLTIKVYAGTASCGQGALLTTYNYTSASSPYFLVPKAPQYYVEVTTACGITNHGCVPVFDPVMSISASSSGCGTVPSPTRMSITNIYEYYVKYPTTVIVKHNSTGINIPGSPFTFASSSAMNTALSNLTPDDYRVIVTDQCGIMVDSEVVANVVNGGAPSLSLTAVYSDCTNQIGAAGINVAINGYIPNLSNATSVIVFSGPSNVGVEGYAQTAGSNIYGWNNMLPGNYVIRVTTPCGITNVSSSLDSSTITGLVRNIKAVATSFCGGLGKVAIDTANTAYNGAGTISYVLVNTTTGTHVDSNSTGSYTNLPAGSYKINMKILDYCSDDTAGTYYEVPSNTVTINAAGVAASVVKKLGVICEDGSGNPLATGTAYLDLAGASPLVLEYKKNTDLTWTTYSSNTPSGVSIAGLIPNQIYDIRLTSCGISATTQVTIGTLNPLNVTNTVNPCLNSPYVLAAPEMPGATYVWKNAANAIISNAYNYTIPNYTASFDGTYTCAISFGSCVTRNITATLNSQLCGLPLPIKLTSFSVSNENCVPQLVWTSVYHDMDKEFIIERSKDGENFVRVDNVPADKNALSYTYHDMGAGNERCYYRLQLVEKDGSFTYSKTEVSGACGDKNNASTFSVIPNPASSGQNITMIYNGTKVSGHYTIVNTAGQTMFRSDNTIIGGNAGSTIHISLQNLNAGVYIITFATDDNKIIGHEKLVVY